MDDESAPAERSEAAPSPRPLVTRIVDRRCFLGVTAAAGLLGAAFLEAPLFIPPPPLTDLPAADSGLALPDDAPVLRTDGLPEPPFLLGIASGDPAPDGMVLWTRLATEPLDVDGGIPARDIPVQWQVASDEAMTKVVANGTALARPGLAHSVHVQVRGLEPGRWWFYRFRVQAAAAGAGRGWVTSPVGRTRTLPAAGSRASRLRFAFASCQDWQAGYWPAWKHLADEDLDLVVHLGDYIYEGARRRFGVVRRHEGPEPTGLDGYRVRHALYKTDPAIQAAHRAYPFVCTWDDHDLQQNYAADTPVDPEIEAIFPARRTAAYQAFWEHLPLPPSARPRGTRAAMSRRIGWGDLAAFHVLDTRQQRTDQPCGGELERRCAEAFNPDAEMLGAAQERWLRDGLDRSKARWNIIAQQVAMTQIRVASPFGDLFNMDQWDGYVAARDRLFSFLDERRPSNPVVITGDLHSSWVSDLKLDFADPDSPTVATEFVGTSISSVPPRTLARSAELLLGANPHIRYVDATLRGYVRCEVTHDEWRADLRTVASTRRQTSPITTSAAFVVENGKPGAEPA